MKRRKGKDLGLQRENPPPIVIVSLAAKQYVCFSFQRYEGRHVRFSFSLILHGSCPTATKDDLSWRLHNWGQAYRVTFDPEWATQDVNGQDFVSKMLVHLKILPFIL